jgi:hypothetical protein
MAKAARNRDLEQLAPAGIGLHEYRTRIVCHLPVPNWQAKSAADRVIAHLKRLRRLRTGTVLGFTVSTPGTYIGHWWSDAQRRWVDEDVVLCLIDFKLRFFDRRLSRHVAQLKQFIRREYARYGVAQEEVWVVAYQVLRHD